MNELEKLAKLIRYFILVSTTSAGSGHPTSSLSATELMTALLFGSFFKFDLKNPKGLDNDRLIFSKGHASPLFYALFAAAGVVTERELLTLRKFGSPLEGHPTMAFPYTEGSTGSLGQGLSIGIGMAINARYIDKLSYRTFVLLGDSEMAEGSQWEAIQIAAYYKLDNLIGILDVNRLGQRGETMYGHDVSAYQKRVSSFGWETIVIDGHSYPQIVNAYTKALKTKDKPTMIIAKTIKGKGISSLEDKGGWHGKALSKEELDKALQELGKIDKSVRGKINKSENYSSSEAKPRMTRRSEVDKFSTSSNNISLSDYPKDKPVATRKAYGNALVRIFPKFPNMVVLDAEVGNSTYSEIFQKKYPERFFEMFIAEQNMVGAALGLSRRGKIPFISTFAAFFTRAFDQIRMSQYSDANIKFVGSHAGVSIGQDGPSQMGLEDIAMFRTLLDSVVLYPSDAVSCEKLVEEAAKHKGNVYIRTTRADTPIIYNPNERFKIGGSKIHRLKVQSSKRKNAAQNSRVVIIAAGITLHEALSAQKKLAEKGIEVIVIDCYSIKPIDEKTLRDISKHSKAIIVVEDHYKEGGVAEAVRSALFDIKIPIHSLAVAKMPKSGKPSELLDYEEISASAIIRKVKEIL